MCGYIFDFESQKEIKSYLSENAKNVKVTVVTETGSTNDEMKKAAAKGEKEISVLVAHSQSAGKGRKGRSFYSPENTGIYMSFLLRPTYTPEECTLLTTMAATVTAESIEKVTGIKTGIKWVNDVFVENRKVAGILTESAFSADKNGLVYAVVGIGINVAVPEKDFPEEIKQIAGALVERDTDRIKNRLIAEIINSFVENYLNLPQKKYLEHYRKRLFFLGKEITVIEGEKTYRAIAADIDSMCHLKVILPDGGEKLLYGGEISVRVDSRKQEVKRREL